MLHARKSNRIVSIKEEDAEKYLSMGYNITDEKGNLLHEAIPMDTASLQTAFVNHTEKIAQLTAEKQTLLEEHEILSKEVAELQAEKNALLEELNALKAKNKAPRGRRAKPADAEEAPAEADTVPTED